MGNQSVSLSKQEQQECEYYSKISGLNIYEVNTIQKIFQSLNPQEGRVSADKFRNLYQNQQEKQQFQQKLGDRHTLSFFEFFELMSQDIQDKKQKYQNIEFESHANPQHPCFYCPYVANSQQAS